MLLERGSTHLVIEDKEKLSKNSIIEFKEKDAEKRYRELTFMQDNFTVFPPYWYMLASTADELGHTKQTLEVYRDITRQHLPFFREDHAYSSALMNKILVIQAVQQTEPSVLTEVGVSPDITQDLLVIIQNSSDDWRKMLFTALQYIQLGRYDQAKPLLMRNIDRDKEVSLHLRVLGDMYAIAQDEEQLTTLIEQMHQDDQVRYQDALYLIGKIRDRRLLERTIESVLLPAVSGITLTVESAWIGKDVLVVSLPVVWVRDDPVNFALQVQIVGDKQLYRADPKFKPISKAKTVEFRVEGVINQKEFLKQRDTEVFVITFSNLAQTTWII